MGRQSRARKRALKRASLTLLPSFSIDDAKEVIREDLPQDADQVLRLIAAANLLCADPKSKNISCDDLLFCVRRGGVAAEMGSRALNVRLGRRRDEDIRMEDFITDEHFWIDYIVDLETRTETSSNE